MALTKTETTQSLEWTEVAQDGNQETSSIDVSDAFQATLHIDCALGTTAAHTGTEIIVQTASEAGVDDAWTDLTRFIGPTGTAFANVFEATTTVGGTSITMDDPATKNLDQEKFLFVEATAAAECEIVYATANSTSAITILDGFTHAHTSGAILMEIDSATIECVKTYPVAIPESESQARVIFNNGYDPDGATAYCRVRVTKETAIA